MKKLDLSWREFHWTILRWISLYPLAFVNALPTGTPSSGPYTIKDTDYYLVNQNNAGPDFDSADFDAADFTTTSGSITWTLFTPVGYASHVIKIKHKGAGDLEIAGTIFTDTEVSSLVLSTGDAVTLTSDGTHWNVGD